MAAEVCLLLMQSLMGDCDAQATEAIDSPPSVVTPAAREVTTTRIAHRANDTITPTTARALPQFGELCQGEAAQQPAICVLPKIARNQAPSSTAASAAIAEPMPLNLSLIHI